jgi:hypothetical protein
MDGKECGQRLIVILDEHVVSYEMLTICVNNESLSLPIIIIVLNPSLMPLTLQLPG